MNLNKKIIISDNAPKALGTYSQGVSINNLLFTSGQIGIDPKSGKIYQDDFLAESRQVLNNIKAILEDGGSSLDMIIKITVFLTDLTNFSDLNTVFEEFFKINPPARSTIEVSALPMGAQVEIEAIGVIR
jgi:2-iminobutanoate/2-iminopropanoate deaminase